jgi:hypothetical protein
MFFFKSQAQPGVVVIKNATIQRINPATGDSKFPKLITDIQQIYLHQVFNSLSFFFFFVLSSFTFFLFFFRFGNQL